MSRPTNMPGVLRGVRVEPDGTRTDIEIPANESLIGYCREQLSGFAEFGYYGRPGATITVAVHETSHINGMPVNATVTEFVGIVRGGPLDTYALHGTALVFGFDPGHGDIVDLPDNLRTQLHAVDETTTGGSR